MAFYSTMPPASNAVNDVDVAPNFKYQKLLTYNTIVVKQKYFAAFTDFI